MGKLWAVIKREYLERVRTKWFIISTLFGPVFFIAISVVPGLLTYRQMRDAQVTNFRILDATHQKLGALVADILHDREANDSLRKKIPNLAPIARTQVIEVAPGGMAAAETTATHAVMQNETRGYLVLDSATLRTGNAQYAGRNASSLGEIQKIENAVRSAILRTRLQSAGLRADQADTISRLRVNVPADRITDQGRGGSGLVSVIFGFMIALLLYMMIILYGQNILRGVLEEKTTRVAEVVLSSISPERLLAGKVIGVGGVGLTQQLIWLAFGTGAGSFAVAMATSAGGAGFTMPHVTVLQMAALVLYFLLGYTFYAALFAAVGAMCSTQEEASQAAQPVMMLLIFTIILMQPVLTNPTSALAKTVILLPFSSPIMMPMVMSASQVAWWQLALSLSILVVSCFGAIWVSARIYRVGLLMTGKRPNLKELVRWIRYA